jgi:hypothetical protein
VLSQMEKCDNSLVFRLYGRIFCGTFRLGIVLPTFQLSITDDVSDHCVHIVLRIVALNSSSEVNTL